MAETVVIKDEDVGNDQAHIDKMVALADGTPQPNDTRPEWLPEKFKSPEEMANAYKSLESKLGSKEPEAPATTEVALDAEAPKPDEVAEELSSRGLDFTTFSDEFAANGSLSDESYGALEAKGIDRAMVDQYIAGQRATAAAYEGEVKQSIGGAEEFDAMVAWAQSNVSNADLASYNKAVASGDPSAARLAVKGMHAQYKESRGSEPKLLKGANGTTASDLYESVQQMTKDMRDPLYKTDPAFRRKVEAKISRSNIL
jgi:hypothetical protein